MALTRTGKLVIAGGVIGLLLVVFGIIVDHVPSIAMKKSVPIGKSWDVGFIGLFHACAFFVFAVSM